MNGHDVSFLRPYPPPRPQPMVLERPIDEFDVFRIWQNAGIIQRVALRSGRLNDSLVGVFAVAFTLGWCVGLFCGWAR